MHMISPYSKRSPSPLVIHKPPAWGLDLTGACCDLGALHLLSPPQGISARSRCAGSFLPSEPPKGPPIILSPSLLHCSSVESILFAVFLGYYQSPHQTELHRNVDHISLQGHSPSSSPSWHTGDTWAMRNGCTGVCKPPRQTGRAWELDSSQDQRWQSLSPHKNTCRFWSHCAAQGQVCDALLET